MYEETKNICNNRHLTFIIETQIRIIKNTTKLGLFFNKLEYFYEEPRNMNKISHTQQ
jgi:hypothetical protein